MSYLVRVGTLDPATCRMTWSKLPVGIVHSRTRPEGEVVARREFKLASNQKAHLTTSSGTVNRIYREQERARKLGRVLTFGNAYRLASWRGGRDPITRKRRHVTQAIRETYYEPQRALHGNGLL